MFWGSGPCCSLRPREWSRTVSSLGSLASRRCPPKSSVVPPFSPQPGEPTVLLIPEAGPGERWRLQHVLPATHCAQPRPEGECQSLHPGNPRRGPRLELSEATIGLWRLRPGLSVPCPHLRSPWPQSPVLLRVPWALSASCPPGSSPCFPRHSLSPGSWFSSSKAASVLGGETHRSHHITGHRQAISSRIFSFK